MGPKGKWCEGRAGEDSAPSSVSLARREALPSGPHLLPCAVIRLPARQAHLAILPLSLVCLQPAGCPPLVRWHHVPLGSRVPRVLCPLCGRPRTAHERFGLRLSREVVFGGLKSTDWERDLSSNLHADSVVGGESGDLWTCFPPCRVREATK